MTALAVGGDAFKGTLFDRELSKARVAIRPAAVPRYVMEPVHFRTPNLLRNDDFVSALNQLVQKYQSLTQSADMVATERFAAQQEPALSQRFHDANRPAPPSRRRDQAWSRPSRNDIAYVDADSVDRYCRLARFPPDRCRLARQHHGPISGSDRVVTAYVLLSLT